MSNLLDFWYHSTINGLNIGPHRQESDTTLKGFAVPLVH
jgi:hypothetical protein